MIFNKISKKHFFKRKIMIKNTLIVRDYFKGFRGYKLKINPKQNLRHVASADIFSEEDFFEDIIKLNIKSIQKDTFEITNELEFN